VIEDAPDPVMSSRHLITLSPTIIPRQALSLEPSGPWDGAMFANASTPQEFELFSKLFNRWRPAIAVLSAAHSTSRADLVARLPKELPMSYHERIITIRHHAVGGGGDKRFPPFCTLHSVDRDHFIPLDNDKHCSHSPPPRLPCRTCMERPRG
jgi:hypothetical protein